jgi:dynein heavy chain
LLAQTLEAVFIFCLVWSLGAAVVQKGSVQDRDRFDKFVKNLTGLGQADTDTLPATQLPAKSLYEYCFDTNDLRWRSWKSLVQEYQVRRERKRI